MIRLVAAAAVVLVATIASTARAQAPQTPQVRVDKLTDNVYLYTYNTHRSLFVVTDEGVLATDPQSPEAAKRYVEEIKKITQAPIKYLVYSHRHADHVSGGSAFGDEPVIIGQANLPGALGADAGAIVPPDVTFAEEATVYLGDLDVRLIYPGPNESDDSIIVFVPDRRVAFMVDAVAVRTLPWRELPETNPDDWIAALETLEALDFDILAPGHGEVGTKAHVREFIGYLNALKAAVADGIEKGQTVEQMQASLELPEYKSWDRYADHFDLNIAGMYRELTRK